MKRSAIKRKAPKYQREYSQTISAKEHKGSCQGCGLNQALTNSHLIPRSYDKSLISEPRNIHDHCHSCHAKCEAGKYEDLFDGKEIVSYINEVRPEYLDIKNLKFEPRIGKTIQEFFEL